VAQGRSAADWRAVVLEAVSDCSGMWRPSMREMIHAPGSDQVAIVTDDQVRLLWRAACLVLPNHLLWEEATLARLQRFAGRVLCFRHPPGGPPCALESWGFTPLELVALLPSGGTLRHALSSDSPPPPSAAPPPPHSGSDAVP